MAFFQTTVGAIILLIVGFVLLVKGADFFVEGASSVAKRLKIPALIIGLTIVALIPVVFAGVFGAYVSFGGTSIIIIVGVVLETIKQVESKMVVRHYKGFLSE